MSTCHTHPPRAQAGAIQPLGFPPRCAEGVAGPRCNFRSENVRRVRIRHLHFTTPDT